MVILDGAAEWFTLSKGERAGVRASLLIYCILTAVAAAHRPSQIQRDEVNGHRSKYVTLAHGY